MKKKVSLKWKIGRYLTFFGVCFLATLFLFQMILLQPMYEKYKIATVKHASDEIVSAIDRKDIADVIYKISAREDVCVRIISGRHDIVVGNYDSPLYRMNDREIVQQIALANDNHGEYLSEKVNEAIPTNGEGHYQDITYTRLVDSNLGEIVVMVYAGLSPVNATVKTLRLQLFYISLILIAFLALLTYLLNRNIAGPLSSINKEAKRLSTGEYQPLDSCGQYLEAEELNHTLEQASFDIQKADQAKRDLIANVSHDLRTPLTMIKGYGEMMLDFPNEQTEENIKVIIDESERLSYLVNDLLDLSKMGSGQVKLNLSDFNLSDVVENQVLKYKMMEKKDGFVIETSIEKDLFVEADQARIEQVINNFIINAINYSKDDKRIKIYLYRKNEEVVFKVEDHGEGIPEEKIKDIWDRYYKIDHQHIRAKNSSGIGLSIAKEILDLHHAIYGVESKIDQGSTFYFQLPYKKII